MIDDDEDDTMDHHSVNYDLDNNNIQERLASAGNGEPAAAL